MGTVDASREVQRSSALEDYAKTIFLLAQAHERVSTSLIAERLCYAPASITGMIQKMVKLGLVSYARKRGVELTADGTRLALEILRHYRQLETCFVEALDFTWDEVHAEAEVLDHEFPDRLAARIVARLGHPAVAPHGDPIPRPDLSLPSHTCEMLAQLPIAASATVVQVLDQHADRLRYLRDLGLVPGQSVMIHARAPFDGPLTIGAGAATCVLDSRMARSILVRRTAPEPDRSVV